MAVFAILAVQDFFGLGFGHARVAVSSPKAFRMAAFISSIRNGLKRYSAAPFSTAYM
ncbi:MAG TPA: hypothetical protein VEU07_03335 [Candidatus Acidoferrum sp.]|nr:hypothetical protein [Candidatus Acidoferrum sp.]